MRRFWLIAALALAACPPSTTPADGGVTDAGNVDAGLGDAGSEDAGTDGGSTLRSCLERPNELARPPNGQLPCELFPPGQ